MNFVVKCIHFLLKALFTLFIAHAIFILSLRKMVLDDIKPEYKCGIAQQDIHLERTLAIFKPDVLEKGVEQEIEDIILNNGFTILDVSYCQDKLNIYYKTTNDFY